jgi:uncharacterized protein YggL (DUF469 family)
MITTSASDEIYSILLQKSKVIDEFLSTTEHLQHALESNDLTAVNQFIKRREDLIQIIDEIDCRINFYRQKYNPDQGLVFVQRMAKMNENHSEKLKKIIPANQKCNTIAASRCESLKKEMATIHQNEEGLHVYAGKTQRMPKFLSVRT